MLPAVLLMTGCAAVPIQTRSEPVTGVKPASTTRPTYTTEQLIQIDLAANAFGEWYLARLAVACDQIATHEATPEARHAALQLKATQAAAVYSIGSGPNPIVGVLDMAVLVNLTHRKWVQEKLAQQTFGPDAALLEEALNDAMKRGHENALRVISETELKAVEVSVEQWRAENPKIVDIEFIRFEDFVDEMAHSLTPAEKTDFLATLHTAAEGLTEARLLGERSMFLMTRMPRLIAWQIDAQLSGVLQQPEARKATTDLSQLTLKVSAMSDELARVNGQLDLFPQKLSDAVASRGEIKQALSAANEAIGRSESAIKELNSLTASLTSLQESTNRLGEKLDQVMKAADPMAMQKMATEGKEIAVREAKSLIYLITGCLAALLILHALLRWTTRSKA